MLSKLNLLPFMKSLFLGVISLLFIFNANSQTPTAHAKILKANLLVGTYTKNGSKGIYVFNFDTATGKAIQLSHTDSATNPSFLAISKDKQFVYAVNETSSGMIAAFSLNNNKLNLLQQKTTKGADPCYVTLSPDQHNIFVANYSSGSITQFHRFANGLLSNAQQYIQHTGSSINSSRQEKAHVHGTFFSPNGAYLLTPDLGIDQVKVYPYSSNASLALDIEKATMIESKPGAGPRHLAFSSNGKYAYLLEELTGSISVYSFTKGKTTFMQTVYTHPSTFNGKPGSADIHISSDGLFLYASNRGEENNIAKFPILSNGKLAENKRTLTPSGGKKPRNFTISEDGNWVLVANQDSDNIVVFKRDKITGDLTNTGNTIKVSMPVCLLLF
jgi:6-phosphogluconolactonase